ncbi:GNAT family N-acetyltransferase [Glycomyces xiaoerkulensis]|uniref:GNAT family N-acetyltransferase n=1 Tax=Glycomyces xiaoerkulensis TaxID=2038139 RepID=UPI000C256DC7|nr:GNAT family N-acetyltransferase [Glycomyces xiaoerkulensis]
MKGVILEEGHAGPVRPVAERIASAFKYLAVADWLVPDDIETRARLMAGQFEMLAAPALEGHGRVDAALDDGGDLAGVAVWLDFTGDPFGGPPDYAERMAELCGEHLPRFQALDEAFERHHPDPAERPHLHLVFCAVDPDRQRQGIGRMLLEAGLNHLDRTGTAGYLEAANVPLTEWYGKHGFESLGPPLRLPEGPSMYPMWRKPR